ncbi:major facilitator superfamily domain-containing protein [Fomitopsis serialis]|uniref:major facilitator superfamily domain-containing protein n=1 Tax=Fomitopsis serialis TaxID=139415 RepID=UPI0020086388|nr:major facilitator superfamily domain-containing protein [Neoantrodia serialis]KAH9920355.1 major facilitator superfamily domain-containing protein [Neoantrodia serialis]
MSLSSASASASFATAPASKPSISGLNPAHDRDAEKGEDGEREVDVIRVVSSHGARDDRREEGEGKQDDGAGGPPPPPDGGTRAWMTVAGAWLVQFSTFGYISSFGVYQDYYATYYLPAETSSNISWIGSLQLCLMYAPGVFVGRAFDAGYFHHLEVLGALLYVFSIFMLSLARPGEYYQVFLAQAVGMGLGLGLTFLPSLSVVGHHFRTRRALAVGVAISGSSAGGIVFPIMLNRLLQDPSVGFANAVRASGAVVGGCLVVANCLMRTRLPPKRGDVHRKGGSKRAARIETWRGMVWDGAYLWSVCGAFLTSLGIYVPLFYLQLFAVDHGVSSHITTYSLAILNAGSTLGRLLPTFLADKVGVYNMLVPAMVACAGLIFAIFGATNGPGVVLVGSIFGFVSGAYISLIPTLLVQLCRNMGELGVKMGLAYSVVAAANLIGNPIAGALLGTNTGGPLTWWRALVFTGVSGAFSLPLPSRFLIASALMLWIAVRCGGGKCVYGGVEVAIHQGAGEARAEGLSCRLHGDAMSWFVPVAIFRAVGLSWGRWR